jgi:hypothetical protein
VIRWEQSEQMLESQAVSPLKIEDDNGYAKAVCAWKIESWATQGRSTKV